MITIKQTKNGAVLTDNDDESMVYEFDDDNKFGLATLLCDMIDAMGMDTSRHAVMRIKVSVVHGDKYECPGCTICQECPVCGSKRK